jgi:hypothetical protein
LDIGRVDFSTEMTAVSFWVITVYPGFPECEGKFMANACSLKSASRKSQITLHMYWQATQEVVVATLI